MCTRLTPKTKQAIIGHTSMHTSCQVHKIKGCQYQCTDWTAHAKQAVISVSFIATKCDAALGQIGL